MHKRLEKEGGSINILRRGNLSNEPKLSWGIFSVALKWGIEKVCIGGGEKGREYQDTTSKIFCPIVPKFFVGDSFGVSLSSGIEKVHA